MLHFYFGESFFGRGTGREPNWTWFAELRLAKLLRRRRLMTLQGCDVRLSDRSAARNEISMCRAGCCQSVAECRAEQDHARRILIDRILPDMDRVFVLNPELAHNVPRAEFLPYACVNVEGAVAVPPKTTGPITILHAPTDPAKKGTRFVVDAVARLQRDYPIRFVQVSNLPHAEALKLYPQADLVIDQLLAGWYGGFAVELMAMGKPVACYIRDEDLPAVPPDMAASCRCSASAPTRSRKTCGGRFPGAPVAGLGRAVAAVRAPLAQSAADRPGDARHLSQPPRRAGPGMTMESGKIIRWLRRLKDWLLCRLTRVALRLMPAAWKNEPVRRSLWAGDPILTLAVNARAERLLGVEADSLVYDTYFISGRFTYNLHRWSRLPLVRSVLPYLVFLWACRRYQRFHFYCNAGLLGSGGCGEFPAEELQMLRHAGEGSLLLDLRATTSAPARRRAAWASRTAARTARRRGGRACATRARAGQRRANCRGRHRRLRYGRHDRVHARQPQRSVLLAAGPGRRRRRAAMPRTIRRPTAAGRCGSSTPRITATSKAPHISSTRWKACGGKGTPSSSSWSRAVPNDRALELYRTADLVFDQCLIGFHGYFALEAMAMGKPVVCFIRKPREYLLDGEECPIVNAAADRLEATLRDLLGDRRRLHQLGRQGRRYVEKHFSLGAFAGRLQRAYDDLGSRRAVVPAAAPGRR